MTTTSSMNIDTRSFVPTSGQAAAIERFREFMDTPTHEWQVFTLCGFAGTGKTTLVKYLVDTMQTDEDGVRPAVRVVAPTGKAASVLHAKGFRGATTVHSFLYHPSVERRYGLDGEVIGEELVFSLKEPDMEHGTRLIVVDEASMVDDDMTRDLLALGIKILAIGDPFQLPPVKESTAGLLDVDAPNAMLTEVTRQAYDSPVLHLATIIRTDQRLLRGLMGDSVVCTRAEAAELSFTGDAPFIVGLNRTRHMQNFMVRKLLGRTDDLPVIGDRLLCRRNDRRSGLINGELFIVSDTFAVSRLAKRMTLEIYPEGDPDGLRREVTAWTPLFYGADGEEEMSRMPMRARRQCQELTWGYAITCHASQGSEWPAVVVMDEGESFGQYRWRWIYTAVTRASQRVAVISG